TSGSACGAGLACRGCVPAPVVPEHSRYRWPDPVSVESAEYAVGVADHVDLGGQAASATSQRMVYRLFWPPFFPAPEEARVARTAVESIIQVSRSIRPSWFSRMCKRSST